MPRMTIRRIPDDFVVDELLNASTRDQLRPADAPGPLHAVYRLRKTSLTTPEAIGRFAKAAGVSPGVVGYGGLKDKHASTTQHISVPPAKKPERPPPATLSGPGWSAELVGRLDGELSAERLEGNRFTIVVRDMNPAQAAGLAERARLLANRGGDLIIVNYFGDQRFGSARHGGGFAARNLIAGDFEGALKLLIGTPARKDSGARRAFTRLTAQRWGEWPALARDLPKMPERRAVETLAAGGDFKAAFAALPNFVQQLCVEAFQSALWNGAARYLARSIAGSPAGAVETDDDFGVMTFPLAERWTAGALAIEPPMLAATTRIDTPAAAPWAEAARAALEEAGVALSDLRIPGLRRPAFGEAPRPLAAMARAVSLSTAEPDELASRAGRLKRTARFELPRGAYATVVLRALGQ